jgi:hypothetical protein
VRAGCLHRESLKVVLRSPSAEADKRCSRPHPWAPHNGCGLSREVTAKSVRSVPHCEQRNRNLVARPSPRLAPMIACRFRARLVAAAAGVRMLGLLSLGLVVALRVGLRMLSLGSVVALHVGLRR